MCQLNHLFCIQFAFFLHSGFAFLLHSGFGCIFFAFWFCVFFAFGSWLHFLFILVLRFFCIRVLVAFFLHSGFVFFFGIRVLVALFLHSGFVFFFCIRVLVAFLHFDFVFVCFPGVIRLLVFCGCVFLLGVLASAASGLVSFSFSVFRKSCHLVFTSFFNFTCLRRLRLHAGSVSDVLQQKIAEVR